MPTDAAIGAGHSGTEPVLHIEKVVKAYQGLRPLRLAALTIAGGERVSVAGVDAGAAELLVNLITGAAVPDQGEIWTFGRRTADISDGNDWLAWLDHFGIVSERSVLLEGSSVEQNLAMPFTLTIDPVPADVAQRVRDLATECGLPDRSLPLPVTQLAPEMRLRAHLARAVALTPGLLLVEHPTARVAEGARRALAADIGRVCASRGMSALVVTNDDQFAQAVAARNLKLDAASGELRPLKRAWFSR
jgi:NitT/TauT family transport system ATP-binding protein